MTPSPATKSRTSRPLLRMDPRTARGIWLVISHSAILWHGLATGEIIFGLFALLLFWTSVYQRRRAGSHHATRMLLTLGPLCIYVPLLILLETLF